MTPGRLLRLLFKTLLVLLAILVVALVGFRVAAGLRETDEGRPAGLRMAPTPLGEVAYASAGPEDGPPILLVHGTAGWSDFWSEVSDHLARQGWRVIAVDLPPFGYSERDLQARYDRTSQAVRLATLLSDQSDRPAVVVAHSFGAGAATELALRAPGRVRSLVLVDAALGELDPGEASPGLAQRALGTRWISEPVTSATITNPLLTGTLLRSMIARTETAERWVETIRRPMRRSGTTRGYAAWLPSFLASDDGGWSRRSERLAAIAMPVELIWGEADTVTPIAQGEALARLMRARALRRLPRVGHIPHIEDPAGFLAALEAAIAPERAREGE